VKTSALFVILALSSSLSLAQSTIDIAVTGIEDVDGWIQIAVYNSPNDFPDDEAAIRIERFRVTGTSTECSIEGLEAGDYSFALFHDVNSNGQCDLNFLGIPTEPYGFSRNVKPVFKAPSFSETKMEISLNTQIEIELIL